MKGLRLAALASLGALGGSFVQATEPANYPLGPLFLTPTLEAELGWTDNLFRTRQDEVDTWKSLLAPRLQAWMQNGPSTYSLTWKAQDFRYFSSHDDDFTDHIWNIDIHQEFNARNSLNLIAEYYDGHEERGTGLSEGVGPLLDEPLELERTIFGGDYTFGGRESRGRLRLAAKGIDHEYGNFKEITRYYDRERGELIGTFFWKVGSRTDALIELRHIDTEYDEVDPTDPAGSLDSEDSIVFVGAEWAATAKTSGSVRFGLYDREYDSAAREDDDGFSWEVDISFRPRSYSLWHLESRRYFRETNGLGDAIDTEEATLTWAHDWSGRSNTELGLTAGRDDYRGSRREDDRYRLEASYNYALRRWLDLGIGYRREDRDSDLDFFDYTRNEIFLRAEFSL